MGIKRYAETFPKIIIPGDTMTDPVIGVKKSWLCLYLAYNIRKDIMCVIDNLATGT